MADGYDVKWTTCDQDVLRQMRRMRDQGVLLDVTLCCEDKLIHCHKLVLAAASTYFRGAFSGNEQTSFLVITGTELKYLELVIDFMYNGVVFVEKDELDEFIKAASDLGLRGLFCHLVGNSAADGDEQHSEGVVSITSAVGRSSTVDDSGTVNDETDSTAIENEGVENPDPPEHHGFQAVEVCDRSTFIFINLILVRYFLPNNGFIVP